MKIPSKKNLSLAIIGFILTGIIGLLDYLTGFEYAFSVFYVLPIMLPTWYWSKKAGWAASIISALISLYADIRGGHQYSYFLIPYWNALIRFASFAIILNLLAALKTTLAHERELSLTDSLTGASNSRHFYAIVEAEINRLKRTQRPFTIAYIDADNFKTINDTFGHAEGDQVIKAIVDTLKARTRNTDLVARLGGDELALFFPDVDEEKARIIFPKIHTALLKEMQKNQWAITFSVGVVTCNTAPDSVSELIKIADDLMYSVKHAGKNEVRYSLFGAS